MHIKGIGSLEKSSILETFFKVLSADKHFSDQY
jgi:hypothetical protein